MLGVGIETEAVFPPSSSARIPAKQDLKEQDEYDIEILTKSKWNNDGNDDGNNCNDNEVIYRRNVWDSSRFWNIDEGERRNNNGVDGFLNFLYVEVIFCLLRYWNFNHQSV